MPPADIASKFRGRNLVTLGVLGTFVGSVYLYSLFAIKQEDFSNVKANPAAAAKQNGNQ
eukprot:m.79784 g.79784  ORF g.79784 m.79784 type:complete len:59 (-) comp17439_c0_seq2:70-246(-)